MRLKGKQVWDVIPRLLCLFACFEIPVAQGYEKDRWETSMAADLGSSSRDVFEKDIVGLNVGS